MKTFQSIQALRAVAAWMVVLGHAVIEANAISGQNTLQQLGKITGIFSHFGVDIFFAISGAIMYLIATQPGNGAGNVEYAGRFAWRRMLRIYPLFWLSIILSTYVGRGMPPPDVWAWVRQLALIDFPTRQPVGWTLVFEIRFYVLVALLVLLFRKRRLGFAVLSAALVLASWLWPAADTATSPIMLEFVMGIAVAAVCKSGIRLPTSALLLGGLAWFLYAAFELYPSVDINAFRWYGFGPPAAMLLCAAMMLEREGRLPLPAITLSAGNASYSTYLWHIGLIGVLTSFWPRGPLASLLYLVAALALTAAASAISYRFIERPLIALSHGRLRRLVDKPVIA